MNEWLDGWMDGSIDCFEWDESILTLNFQYLEKYTHTQFETYNFNGLPLKIRNQVFVERTTGGYRSLSRHSH